MKRSKFYDTRHINDDEPDDGPSKSELKRQSSELQALGESLIELPAHELDALELPEKLRDAIDIAKRIDAHGGLYRQKQFIGKLMRKIDVEPIRAALEAKRQAHRTDVLRFRRLEQWRDRLLHETDALAAYLLETPHANRAELERLISRARHEAQRQQAPAAARALFTLLRSHAGDIDGAPESDAQ